jgi:hypothetical protein
MYTHLTSGAENARTPTNKDGRRMPLIYNHNTNIGEIL